VAGESDRVTRVMGGIMQNCGIRKSGNEEDRGTMRAQPVHSFGISGKNKRSVR